MDETHQKISMANSFPCHPTFRAVPLLKSLVLRMALPALQSSLKRKTGAGEPNRGISTHQFSALYTPLSAIHQPLTDLFTAQSGLCLAAHYTLKSSFDTLSVYPCPILCLPMESAELSGQFMEDARLSRRKWHMPVWCNIPRDLPTLLHSYKENKNKTTKVFKQLHGLFPGDSMKPSRKAKKTVLENASFAQFKTPKR